MSSEFKRYGRRSSGREFVLEKSSDREFGAGRDFVSESSGREFVTESSGREGIGKEEKPLFSLDPGNGPERCLE